MSKISTALHDFACRVVFNRDCGHQLKLLRLQLQPPFSDFACKPGQFVMLDLPESRFYFRRPFSVLDTPAPDLLDIYYKIVGTGTQIMAELKPDDALKCLGPLGNTFSAPQEPKTALYIGGGIGVAPLYFMGKSQPKPGHCFYGVRNQAEVGLEADLRAIFGENLSIATDDGSYGFHGNVCHLLEANREKVLQAKEATICGPTRMMEAAANLLHSINPALRVEVSLEAHMPCGTGACTGCVTPRADQYLPSKVCVEGPVFDARAIQWDGQQRPLSEFCEESPCTP